MKLSTQITNDGSRWFVTLRASADWYAVRDHVSALSGATLTGFLTDHITECWIDFQYAGHKFTIHDPFGEYWFSVKDPKCPDEILQAVAEHFANLLEK